MNNILLTGATGFVGKVVLYDLLKRKDELFIDKIYLPIRGRGVRNAESRFKNEIAKSELFYTTYENWQNDVISISGELSLKNCDFSEEDYALLNNNITHIIHCAASVDFDLSIEDATAANIDSALNVLEFAKKCKLLKKMVTVSTAYVTPHREGKILEVLHQLPFDVEKMYADIKLKLIDEDLLMNMTGHPNTYTLTKCMSEHILFNRKEFVPLSIVRPSIISATVENPCPGWIDSSSTIAAFVILASSGYCKVFNSNSETMADFVPCDVVSKNIIKETFSEYKGFNIRYAIGKIDNSPSQSEFTKIFYEYFSKYKHGKKAVLAQLHTGDSFIINDFLLNKLHLKVLSAIDKKSSEKLKKLMDSMHRINGLFEYFTTHTYDFESKHDDIELNFNSHDYVRILTEGISKRILKYDPKKVKLSGKLYRNTELSDLYWSLTNHKDKFAIKAGSFILRKNLPKINSLITFDLESFYTTKSKINNNNIVIVPSHRSYLDFLLCSYLFYSHPEIGIKVPYIVAAEDFSKIPLIGKVFKSMKAFYIKRGTGKEDPELSKTITDLLSKEEIIQFFIEGTRSRSRKFLKPKTGILRCIQNTKKDFAILPISISYDKLPEENVLIKEYSTGEKEKMKLLDLVGWYKKVISENVSLGKIHIKCGDPVFLNEDSDVKIVSKNIIGELQRNMTVSTYHLKSFLKCNKTNISLEYLKNSLIERGVEVLDSDLKEETDSFKEIFLRQQWIYHFYNDAIYYYPNNKFLQFEKDQNLWYDHNEVFDFMPKDFIDNVFDSLFKDSERILLELKNYFYSDQKKLLKVMVNSAHPIYIYAIYDYLTSIGIITYNKNLSFYEKLGEIYV